MTLHCAILTTVLYSGWLWGLDAFVIDSSTLRGTKKRTVISPDSRKSGSISFEALLQAKSICTFDESDFAGSVGDWPYTEADVNRLDNSDDSRFYDLPRFVRHIDDNAIKSLCKYYEEEFVSLLSQKEKKELDVLDLCSSWISHLPEEKKNVIEYGKVIGIGMNGEELEANPQLTDYFVQDLNKEASLIIPDNSIDIVCNVVSVDYLTKPLEVFQEIHRVLRPGGIALMSFSNRCFPTKAIAMWLQADDIGRLTIVGSYFNYSAKWRLIEALDLKDMELETPDRPSAREILSNPAVGLAWLNAASAVAQSKQGDPMFVVKAVK